MYQTFFYQPILNFVIFLYNIIPGHDLGVVIILFTFIIKLLLYPLSQKSLKSQKELQELQPKIEEIKKEFKNDKEGMSKAMMVLYKNNKVNPFSSCLPLLIQLPFLFAIFKVFRVGFENGALKLLYPFVSRPESINYISFGFLDLQAKSLPIAILAGLAQFWQARMMVTKRAEVKTEGAKDEDMMAIMNKQMVYMMPVLTVFIGMSFPAGLGLYWLFTTLFTGVQQLYLFKKTKIKNNDDKAVVEGEVIKK